jgi:hypothetical protein
MLSLSDPPTLTADTGLRCQDAGEDGSSCFKLLFFRLHRSAPITAIPPLCSLCTCILSFAHNRISTESEHLLRVLLSRSPYPVLRQTPSSRASPSQIPSINYKSPSHHLPLCCSSPTNAMTLCNEKIPSSVFPISESQHPSTKSRNQN